MNKTFDDLFWSVFADLSEVERKAIETYWQAWGVAKPRIITNPELTRHTCFGSILAHTNGENVLSDFYFRDFVVLHAPTVPRITLILHELAHCYLYSQSSTYGSPEAFERTQQMNKALQKAGIPNRTLNQLSQIESDRDEQKARVLSNRWGGDEDALEKWASQFLAEHAEYDH